MPNPKPSMIIWSSIRWNKSPKTLRLAELLEINATLLNAHNEELAKICETFALQAHAQVLIADTFIDLMDEGAELAETYAPTTTIYNDNVIPFPGTMNAS